MSYYELHKEECKKRAKEYYHNVAKYTIDRKKLSQYNANYYLKHKQEINERHKKNNEGRRKLSPEERRERHNMSVKRYYEKKKELIREYKREYARRKYAEKKEERRKENLEKKESQIELLLEQIKSRELHFKEAKERGESDLREKEKKIKRKKK